MNKLTLVAALPGSGGGVMASLPAEVGKIPPRVVFDLPPVEDGWQVVCTFDMAGTVLERQVKECEGIISVRDEPVGIYMVDINEPRVEKNHRYTEYGRDLFRRFGYELPPDAAGGGE